MTENDEKPIHSPLGITDLVTDLDNNWWDWVAMHAPGMKAMAELISQRLTIPVEKVKESMAQVYKDASSLDFDQLIQHMDVVIEKVVLDSMKSYSDPNAAGLHIFKEGMGLLKAVEEEYQLVSKQKLQLYPGVREVLETLHRNRVRIHALTDAPVFKTISRIKRLGLEGLVTTLYAQPNIRIRPEVANGVDKDNGTKDYIRSLQDQVRDHVPEHDVEERIRRGHYQTSHKVVPLRTMKKPNVELHRLLGFTRERVQKTVAVWGDSPKSDMGLAAYNQCVGFYSAYGVPRQEHLDILNSLGNPKGVNRDMESDDPTIRGIREKMGDQLKRIQDPLEILDHFGIPRPTFGGK